MPFRQIPLDREDNEVLIDFMSALKKLFMELLEMRNLIPVELRTDFQESFDAVQPDFEQIINLLRKIDREHWESLERHGLRRSLLRAKIRLIVFFNSRFRRQLEQTRAGEIPRSLRWIIKKLLSAINIPLGSLVAAIGIGEPIKELKEAFETIVDIEE